MKIIKKVFFNLIGTIVVLILTPFFLLGLIVGAFIQTAKTGFECGSDESVEILIKLSDTLKSINKS